MRSFAKYIFIFCLSVHSTAALAAGSSPSPKESKGSLEQDLIRGNITVSEWIDSVAEDLDLFLTGRKLTKKSNKTSVRIENSTTSSEGHRPENVTHINVNLRLPNVEEYFQVMFSSYDEQKERGMRRRYLHQQRRKENFGATVGVFKSIGKVKTRFQPRIELRDPLKIGHSLSFETLMDARFVIVYPRHEFFADPDRGTGTFDILNFTYPIDRKFSLTQVNEAEYDDKILPHFRGTNGLSLNHVVNDLSFLTYSILFESINERKYRLDSYDFAIAWNQLIYRRIFSYQAVPHWNFSKGHRWKGEAGFVLNLFLDF
jgi:hypothetical protein